MNYLMDACLRNYLKMKTSPSQFEILVNFMEHNGDLNKPTGNALAKLRNIQGWEEVGKLLNSDPMGTRKTVEKWKKVWSDLKNNTKKKIIKIKRASCGPGMIPKLTDIEARVLAIMGSQAATGPVQVNDAEVSQPPRNSYCTITQIPSPVAANEVIYCEVDIVKQEPFYREDSPTIEQDYKPVSPSPSPPATEVPPASPPATAVPPASPLEDQPGPSHRRYVTHPSVHGYIPSRSLRRSTRKPRRHYVRLQTYNELFARFRQSNAEWRRFLQQKHEDSVKLEAERIRIREMQLEVHREWQAIARETLEALNKIIDSKLCKD